MKMKILVTVFAVFALLTSCKKADKGATGPAGSNGTNGTNGNANVKLFYFGKDSIMVGHTSATLILPASVTNNMIDSSAVMVYHNVYGNWYFSPGLGNGGSYQTRIFIYGTGINFKSSNPDGTTYSGAKSIISQFKVVIIPSSDYKGSRKKPVDFTDYKATMKYYGLPLD